MINSANLRKSKTMNSLRKNEAIHFLEEENETKKLCAKDAMIKPILLSPEDNTEKILKKLKKEHINACIVVTKEKKFIGEITNNDIIKLFLQQVKCEPLVKILNHGYRREFLYKTAKEMINKHKSFVKTDTSINNIIKLMWKEEFEYIPVLNKKDQVVGVITPSSLINLLKDY
ncbi:MAG: CBS domain-containing protein [Nanoarchaeota archaeon]|nr:CBS domain-containing protein [Nanoarchaeota archaeon]